MLSTTDLKLFEILDEFINKSLSFGCLVFFDWEIIKYIWEEESNHKRRYDFELHLWVRKSQEIHWGVYTITLKDFDDNIWEYVWIKPIWHYPTLSTVLRYLWDTIYETKTNWIVLKIMEVSPQYQFVNFIRDLTTELQHRSEEKKQELLLFLQSL